MKTLYHKIITFIFWAYLNEVRLQIVNMVTDKEFFGEQFITLATMIKLKNN